jgi:SAM-dependent methyltransferase
VLFWRRRETAEAAVGQAQQLQKEFALSQSQLSEANQRILHLTACVAELEGKFRASPDRGQSVSIRIARGDLSWLITPDVFEVFAFKSGDELTVEPPDVAARLPITWGDINIQIERGRSIRVPSHYEFFDYKGFHIPVHLILLTGAGPDTLELIGKAHIELYDKFCGLGLDMTLLEIGCGIGRDALQLIDRLSERGRYIGIDVTRDSIIWCKDNVSTKYPNFVFHHFDAENELYNPHGAKTSMDFTLPVADWSVDRIFLASVFTHLFEEEVLHYMKEFARVLKPDGQVYASFFLWSPAALEAAKTRRTTPWAANFDIALSDGVYTNDRAYPRGGVAFTDAAMRRLIDAAGLRLLRPYLKGSWSGLYDDPDEGQDVSILGRA